MAERRERKVNPIPRLPDGSYDREAVRLSFLASPYLDWTRFAEEQGWDPHKTRQEFQVRTWQEEKKRRLAENQTDIIAGLIHERRFEWTRDILDTMKRYPRLIDMGSQLMEAKMSQLGELYKEYVEWKAAGNHIVKLKNGNTKRVYHAWERLSLMDMSFLSRSLRDLAEAKKSALMLDKWSIARIDVPVEELQPQGEGDGGPSHSITIEGRKEITFADMQRWFDEFADKPPARPEDDPSNNEGSLKEPLSQPSFPNQIDDKGNPVG